MDLSQHLPVDKGAQLEDLIDLCHELMKGQQALSSKELEDLVDRVLIAFPEWVDLRDVALRRLEVGVA